MLWVDCPPVFQLLHAERSTNLARCFRALRFGGVLLAGFANPVRYIFDGERMENGSLNVRWSIPYSDLNDLADGDRQRTIVEKMQPLEFGHTLEDQIGGQLDAGFVITGFYEIATPTTLPIRFPASSLRSSPRDR